jgi:integrase/recombinase XerD
MVKTKLRGLALLRTFWSPESSMSTKQRVNGPKRRGQTVKAQSDAGLADVARATSRLWRKHHLSYDQTKYVVERARRALGVEPPHIRRRTVQRLDYPEVERLIRSAYRDSSAYGVMIKTLFLTGARVNEFVHIRVEDLHLDDELPQIYLTHAKREASRYVPVLPALAQELRTHLQGRRQGYLFESNRHTLYSVRTVQAVVERFARQAGIAKRVYPHLLRHSIATILLDSGLVPIDQVQKFLGHLQLSTTQIQIYAETSTRALGENYVRALAAANRS